MLEQKKEKILKIISTNKIIENLSVISLSLAGLCFLLMFIFCVIGSFDYIPSAFVVSIIFAALGIIPTIINVCVWNEEKCKNILHEYYFELIDEIEWNLEKTQGMSKEKIFDILKDDFLEEFQRKLFKIPLKLEDVDEMCFREKYQKYIDDKISFVCIRIFLDEERIKWKTRIKEYEDQYYPEEFDKLVSRISSSSELSASFYFNNHHNILINQIDFEEILFKNVPNKKEKDEILKRERELDEKRKAEFERKELEKNGVHDRISGNLIKCFHCNTPLIDSSDKRCPKCGGYYCPNCGRCLCDYKVNKRKSYWNKK